jgi:DnaJ-class molecular chaperone
VVNYYHILDVPANASLEEIKRAYRLKSKAYHPDLNKRPEAVDKLLIVNKAYQVLSVEHSRIQYDAQLQQVMASKRVAQNFHYDFASNYPNRKLYGDIRASFSPRVVWLSVIFILLVLFFLYNYQ